MPLFLFSQESRMGLSIIVYTLIMDTMNQPRELNYFKSSNRSQSRKSHQSERPRHHKDNRNQVLEHQHQPLEQVQDQLELDSVHQRVHHFQQDQLFHNRCKHHFHLQDLSHLQVWEVV